MIWPIADFLARIKVKRDTTPTAFPWTARDSATLFNVASVLTQIARRRRIVTVYSGLCTLIFQEQRNLGSAAF